MEYAPGGTLQNFINQQPNRQLTEQDARWFFQQFVIAMDYCHTMVRAAKIDSPMFISVL